MPYIPLSLSLPAIAALALQRTCHFPSVEPQTHTSHSRRYPRSGLHSQNTIASFNLVEQVSITQKLFLSGTYDLSNRLRQLQSGHSSILVDNDYPERTLPTPSTCPDLPLIVR